MELYVWWHAPVAQRAAAVEATRKAQSQAAAAVAGLTARLLIRPELDRERVTLMEVYSALGGLDDAHRAALATLAAQLAPFAAGGRHEEWFEPVD